MKGGDIHIKIWKKIYFLFDIQEKYHEKKTRPMEIIDCPSYQNLRTVTASDGGDPGGKAGDFTAPAGGLSTINIYISEISHFRF